MVGAGAEFITSMQLVAGPSAIVGVTAMAGQIGIMIDSVGGTMAISGQSVGSSFWAGNARVNTVAYNVTLPIRGTFYFSGVGATTTAHVTRFF